MTALQNVDDANTQLLTFYTGHKRKAFQFTVLKLLAPVHLNLILDFDLINDIQPRSLCGSV